MLWSRQASSHLMNRRPPLAYLEARPGPFSRLNIKTTAFQARSSVAFYKNQIWTDASVPRFSSMLKRRHRGTTDTTRHSCAGSRSASQTTLCIERCLPDSRLQRTRPSSLPRNATRRLDPKHDDGANWQRFTIGRTQARSGICRCNRTMADRIYFMMKHFIGQAKRGDAC